MTPNKCYKDCVCFPWMCSSENIWWRTNATVELQVPPYSIFYICQERGIVPVIFHSALSVSFARIHCILHGSCIWQPAASMPMLHHVFPGMLNSVDSLIKLNWQAWCPKVRLIKIHKWNRINSLFSHSSGKCTAYIWSNLALKKTTMTINSNCSRKSIRDSKTLVWITSSG